MSTSVFSICFSKPLEHTLNKILAQKLVWLAWVLVWPATGLNQEVWSLDDCIHHAREHHIPLRQQQLRATLAGYDLQEARWQLFPSAGISASQTNRFGRSVDPLTYEFSTEDSRGAVLSTWSDLTLFSGFRGITTIRKKQLDLEIQLARLDQAKNNLDLLVTRTYLEALFQKERVQSAQEQAALTGQLTEQARKLIEAGALTRQALLDLQAQLGRDNMELVEAQNDHDLALLSLAQVLNLDEPERLHIREPGEEDLLPAILPDPKELFSQAQGRLPQIRASALEVQRAEKDLRLAQGAQMPSLTMTTGWGTGYSDQITDALSGNIMGFRDQLRFTSTTYLRFGLQIPVFDGLSGWNRIREAKIMITDRELALEAEKQGVKKEIEMSYAASRAALAALEAGQLSVDASREAFSHAEQRFSLGMITLTDLEVTKNNLKKAQAEWLHAKYRYIFNLRILDFYRKSTYDEQDHSAY